MQSGLSWFRKFRDGIKEKGFEQSDAGPCAFRRIVDGKAVTMIMVYVDDILLASKTKEDVQLTLSRVIVRWSWMGAGTSALQVIVYTDVFIIIVLYST